MPGDELRWAVVLAAAATGGISSLVALGRAHAGAHVQLQSVSLFPPSREGINNSLLLLGTNCLRYRSQICHTSDGISFISFIQSPLAEPEISPRRACTPR